MGQKWCVGPITVPVTLGSPGTGAFGSKRRTGPPSAPGTFPSLAPDICHVMHCRRRPWYPRWWRRCTLPFVLPCFTFATLSAYRVSSLASTSVRGPIWLSLGRPRLGTHLHVRGPGPGPHPWFSESGAVCAAPSHPLAVSPQDNTYQSVPQDPRP